MSIARFRLVDKGVYQHLSTDGIGTIANIGMNVDGSVTPVQFYIDCTNFTGPIVIARIIVHYHMSGTWRDDRFGSINGGLTNGVDFGVRRNGVKVLDLDAGEPIKTNGAWGRLCYDRRIDTLGGGPTYCSIRYTLSRAGWDGVVLRPTGDERLCACINDDLTSLDDFTVMAQGYVI